MPYALNFNYSLQHSVVGIGSNLYILGYYRAGVMNNRTADPSAEVEEGGPLMVQLCRYNADNHTIDLLNEPVEYLSSSPGYFLSSAPIDNSTAVFVFADRKINYGLLAVLVSVDAVYNVLQFGSSLALSTGQALGAGSSAVMDLDVTAVPPDPSRTCGSSMEACTKNSFTVVYSDATNNGLVTVASAKVLNGLG